MHNTDFSTLKTDFDGQIILPEDQEYEKARNTMFGTGEPAVIVQPRTAQAVAQAVTFAREYSLEISLRSGGHSGAGFGTNTGGMVIDVSLINNVDIIDQEKKLVRLGSGAHWSDVAKELGKHGLSVSSGDTKTVGVAGLTLGGGFGWMLRKYGLAIDCLVAAEIVTADGQIVRTSDQEHPDLFWAIRGGGGNFGVLTQLEFEAHATGKVLFGSIAYELNDLAALLKGWRDVMRDAPAELTSSFLIVPPMGGNPASAMVLCCVANADKSTVDPLLQIGTVVYQDVAEKDYADILQDGHAPAGMKAFIHNTFIEDMSDEVIETIADEAGQNQMMLQLRSVSGALNDVPAEATAFAHRQSEVLIISPVFLPLDASDDEIEKALAPWHKIAAYGKGGCINFFSRPEEKVVETAYPQATLKRLAEVKKAYDPQNIFHHNFNILPVQD